MTASTPLLCTALAALLASPLAWGQEPSPLQLRTLAATCAACHGTQGQAVSGASVSALAGLKQDFIAEQMKAFKNGQRPATVMHQLAKGYTDEQIDQLAGYFARQRP